MNEVKQNVALVVAALLVSVGIGMATAGAENPAHGEMQKEEVANPYPLKTCVVSGEELGGMGEPYKLVFKQEIKFCCKGCVKDFKKDPLKYMAKLAAAAEKEETAAASKHGDKSEHESSGQQKEQDHSGHHH